MIPITSKRQDLAKPAESVIAMLAKVNGKATAFTVTEFTEVHQVAIDAEKRLNALGVPLKYRPGAALQYRPAGPGKAYARKSRFVISTILQLVRVADGWRLVSAERSEPWADSPELRVLMISAEAYEQARAHLFQGVTVAGVQA